MSQLAYAFDIDGTLALLGDRGVYDWPLVGRDRANEPVIRAARAMKLVGPVIFITGRPHQCHGETREWITRNVCDHSWACFCGAPLFMRQDGDFSKDTIVKPRLLTQAEQQGYTVLGVFEDAPHMVPVWEDCGLEVFHVSRGSKEAGK